MKVLFWNSNPDPNSKTRSVFLSVINRFQENVFDSSSDPFCELKQSLGVCGACVLFLPEYHGGMPSFLKLAFEKLDPKLIDSRVFFLCTVHGSRFSGNAAVQTAVTLNKMNALVYPKNACILQSHELTQSQWDKNVEEVQRRIESFLKFVQNSVIGPIA